MRVPPTLRHYLVPSQVLAETHDLLWDQGRRGLEAVVVWVGRVVDATTGEVVVAVRPRQVAYATAEGVAVEVTQEGLSELISALPDGTAVLARVHTHPGGAYHSHVDDGNMLVAHRGAVSIVVPDFAREPIDLQRCSVNELTEHGWRELGPEERATRFTER